VGPSLAQAIAKDRAQHGPFRSVADLNRVHGIGDKLLAKLSPFIKASSK
jgi:competence protein ComEA